MYGVLLLWAVVAIIVSMHHEIWRDEMRALSLATKSTSILDLPHDLLNEGHPLLWYIILKLAFWIYPNTIVLKIVSFLIGLATVYLLLFKCNLPRNVAILVAFSQFFMFENTVMCRNYGISALLILLYTQAFLRKNMLFSAILLALLMQTNVVGFVTGGVMFIYTLWTHAQQKNLLIRDAVLSTALIIGSAFCFYSVTNPDAQSQLAGFKHDSLSEFLINAAVSLVYPNYLFTKQVPIIGFVIVLILASFFWKNKLELLVFWIVVAALNLFSIEVNILSMRHLGVFFAFFLFLWIVTNQTRTDSVFGMRLNRHILPSLLFGLVGANIFYCVQDVLLPESSSKELSEYIQTSGYSEASIIADPDYIIDALPYYLTNRMYLPREDRFGAYTSFTKKNKCSLCLSEITSLKKSELTCKKPLLFVSRFEIVPGKDDTLRYHVNAEKILVIDKESTYKFRPLKAFQHAMQDENYYLYEVLD